VYLGKGKAVGLVRFAFVATFNFEPAFGACLLDVVARNGFRAAAFRLGLAMRLPLAAFLDTAIFFSAFLTRSKGFDNFALARSGGLDSFDFARSGGLDSFDFARSGDFEGLALARSEGFASFALERRAELDSFGLVRTIGFAAFAFSRAMGLDDFTNFFVLIFVTPAPFAFVALRAGAFVASEPFIINVGRDDLPDNARLFAEDVAALRRETGLDNDRLTLLTVRSLMRSSKLSKKVTQTL
jgi:hypothetical protein